MRLLRFNKFLVSHDEVEWNMPVQDTCQTTRIQTEHVGDFWTVRFPRHRLELVGGRNTSQPSPAERQSCTLQDVQQKEAPPESKILAVCFWML